MLSVAVSRKKALLLFLAQREAERLGVSVEAAEIQKVVEGVREQNLLVSEKSLHEWLAAVGWDAQGFHAFMRECAVVAKLEDLMGDQISVRAKQLTRMEQVRKSAVADLPSTPRMLASAGWLQVNVSFKRQNGGVSASSALFDALRDRLAQWRREDKVTLFFFVRKSPDVRLRFLCSGTDESQVAGELELTLQQLQQQGFVQHFFRSFYEPEQARFGGPEGVRLVHDYFDADTLEWMLLEQIAPTKSRGLPRVALMTSVLNHLFASVVEDPAEVWDIWCQCSELIGGESVRIDEDYLDPAFAFIEPLRRLASPDETAVLTAYETANLALAAGLKGLWHEGKLRRGVRGILADIAVFGLNRHGIDRRVQSQLIQAIRRGFAARKVVAGLR